MYRLTKIEIPSKHDIASIFMTNFNKITRNNCLNKTTLILAVSFLLSIIIFYVLFAFDYL